MAEGKKPTDSWDNFATVTLNLLLDAKDLECSELALSVGAQLVHWLTAGYRQPELTKEQLIRLVKNTAGMA